MTPFVELNILAQENGCHLLSGDASDPEGSPLTYEWTALDQDTGAETLLGTELSLMVCLPSGTYIVSFKATDDEGASSIDRTSLVIEARRSAPDLKIKSAAPAVLWPPNGKLWPVQLAYEVTHDPQTRPEVRIVSVRCNQRLGQNEIVQAGPLELYLAARRTSRFGERVYEVTIEASDEHGSKDQETITIRVPADSESNVSTYTGRKTTLSQSGKR